MNIHDATTNPMHRLENRPLPALPNSKTPTGSEVVKVAQSALLDSTSTASPSPTESLESKVSSPLPLPTLENAISWKASVLGKNEKNTYEKININTFPLSEFALPPVNSINKVKRLLESIREIKNNENYELYRDILAENDPNSFHTTLDKFQSYLEKKLEELTLKKEIGHIYRATLNPKNNHNLAKLHKMLSEKLKEILEFYNKNPTVAIDKKNYIEMLTIVINLNKPGQKAESIQNTLKTESQKLIDQEINNQEEKLHAEFDLAHDIYVRDRSPTSFLKLKKATNKLIIFYEMIKDTEEKEKYNKFLIDINNFHDGVKK